MCVFRSAFKQGGYDLTPWGGSWQEKDNSNRNPIHGNIFGRVSFPYSNIFIDGYGTVFKSFCISSELSNEGCLKRLKQRSLKRLEDFANPSSVRAGLMHQPNVSPNANKPVKNMKNTKEHDNSEQNVY